MTTGYGFCSNCGTPRVSAGQKFCAGCGLTLSVLVPPAPPAPPAPSAPSAPPVVSAEMPAPPELPVAAPAPVPGEWMSPIPPPPAPEPEAAIPAPPAPPAPEPITAAEAPAAPPPWATFAAQPPVAQPVTPPAWSMPPAGAQTAPPQWATPPAQFGAPAAQAAPQAAPPAPPYPPAYPGAPAPAAPGKPIATVAGIKVTPKLLAIGGIALAVIVAVVYMSMGSKSGGITFAPSTFSCSSSVQVTTTIQLPSSLKGADRLVWQLDGVPSVTSTVADNFKSQADGSWLFTDTTAASSSCLGPSGSQLSMGTHTYRILDASGRVLAEGSLTLTP